MATQGGGFLAKHITPETPDFVPESLRGNV
jgi:hypothetical protein